MYTLMNKDRKLLDFVITGGQELERCRIEKQYEELPFWITGTGAGISQWIEDRSAAKHRRHVREILEKCGGYTKSGFIGLTHCLSLNDTLWVRDDAESVLWNDVSLYINKFNEVISKLSFDGNGLYGERISTSSPELTTDGTYDKCWIQEEGCIKLIKAGSAGAGNAGREPYGEVLASPVYKELCNEVTYTLRRYHGRTVSCCNMFTDEAYGYKSAAACGLGRLELPYLLDEYAKYGQEDAFRRMMIADAVTVNTDRHYGNFGFLVDNDTFRITGINPVFDYNLALFPYADWYEGFPDMDRWIAERGPRLGSSYYNVADSLMTPAIRSQLINLKDLELTIETDETFNKERLEIVNRFKNIQIDRLLGNRRQFDFNDIRRKYGSETGREGDGRQTEC